MKYPPFEQNFSEHWKKFPTIEQTKYWKFVWTWEKIFRREINEISSIRNGFFPTLKKISYHWTNEIFFIRRKSIWTWEKISRRKINEISFVRNGFFPTLKKISYHWINEIFLMRRKSIWTSKNIFHRKVNEISSIRRGLFRTWKKISYHWTNEIFFVRRKSVWIWKKMACCQMDFLDSKEHFLLRRILEISSIRRKLFRIPRKISSHQPHETTTIRWKSWSEKF